MGSKNKSSKRDKKQVTDSSQDREDIGNRRGNSGKKDIVTDPRFSHVHYDPKFARARKQKTKVAIDSRFDQIFTDKNFSSSSALVDKRGKLKKKDIENPLKHYYHLEDDEGRIKEVNEDLISQTEDDDVANEESESESENAEAHKESESESENNETNEESENESDIDELKKFKGKVQDIESEDEDEEDEEDEDEDEEAESDRSSADTTDTTDSENEEEVYSMEQDNFEQEENVPEIDKETNRLGVVNLDWNHVRAVDIFMLFTSFLPKGGKMLSVSVYPSEFGLKRMEEEAVRGPVGLFDDDAEKNDDSEDDDDNDNADEIDDNKLRAYELSRLRYYYAVVECDSVATADYLYKTCDGLEFERSSNRLDLRFIPDSMEFKHPPRDVATEAPSNYEGMDFHSKVLQLSKIELTWDEDEPQRSKSLKRKFNADQLADMELKEFLASDDSESESDDENDDDDDVTEHKPEKKRRKQELYRALLQSGGGSDEDNDDNKGDMEVTFNTGLEELSKKHLEKKDKESETVWEAYLRKKKEKKKSKKNRSKNSSDDESGGSDEEPRQEDADDFFIEEPTGKADKKQKKQKGAVDEAEAGIAELELLLANDDGEIHTGLKGYNMKAKKKSKGKKGNKNNSEENEDDGKLPTAADYDDPRFSSLFTAPLFSLDPTDPQFKRSAVYARQLAQKQGKSGREEKGAKQNKEVPEPTMVVPIVENDPLKLEASSKKKDKLELSSLVKSLKMKSQHLQMSSKNKQPSNSKRRK